MSASYSTSYVIPLSIGCSNNTRFSSSSPSSLSSLIISGGRTVSFSNFRLRLTLDSATNHRAMSRVRVRIPWRTPWGIRSQRFRTAVSRAEPEPDRIDDSKIKEEIIGAVILHMIHGERHFPLTKDTWHPIRGEKDLLKDFNSLLIAYIDIINVAILPTDESK